MTPPAGERGSLSIWFVTTTVVMITLVGLAADLGGQVHAQQRARDVAAQAARAGGQQVDASAAIQGQRLTVDTSHARAAANRHLDAADVNGTVTVHGLDTITVHVTDTYHPRFLGLIGIDQLTVTGTAKARLVRSIGGTEQ